MSGAGRTHGHGEDDPPGPTAAERAKRGLRSDTRREAVVDHDDIAIVQIRQHPRTSIEPDPPFQFRLLLRGEPGELPDRQAEPSQRGFAGHDLSAFGDRADPELRLTGGPDLASDEHVERRAQRLRDLESDRHPTARKRQHDRSMQRRLDEAFRELAACVAPVSEPHVQPSS